MIKSLPTRYEDIFVNQRSFYQHLPEVTSRSILITGAQGMIGNAVARSLEYLQDQGYLQNTHLYLTSRKWPQEVAAEYKDNPKITLIRNSSIKNLGRINLAIHIASPSNVTHINSLDELREVNSGLLEHIRILRPERIVYLSSGEVYRGENLAEDSHFVGFSESVKRDWYPIAKLETEELLQRYESDEKISAHVIRLFHTYGPGVKINDGRSFADILWGSVLHNEIVLRSAGKQVRSFLYLSDAVNGILAAAFSKNTGFHISNLGSDTPISILEFAEAVAEATNSKISFAEGQGFMHSPNDYLVPTLDNIYKLGWKPRVDLETGIFQTINWIRNSIQL